MPKLQSGLQLGALLGKGHFGEVYEGTDPVHGKVAVKVLSQAPGESATDWHDRRQGLLSEGQRLAAATHTHVVRVLHLVESDTSDQVMLVMEFCSGGSLLTEYTVGPLLIDRVRRLATEIGLGLQSLHNRGMIHRDIKPANVLIDGAGKARLGDFGLVTDKLVLGYASQKGYLDHVAFEVHHGKGTSVRSDIWAWGATIYRLLHGGYWYDASPVPKFVVPAGDFAKRLKWLPHVPQDWRRLIRKMLHDDSTLRFQTASEVLNALARVTTEPSWECTVNATEILFKRQTPTHDIDVAWDLTTRDRPWSATGVRRTDGLTRSRGNGSKEGSLTEFLASGG